MYPFRRKIFPYLMVLPTVLIFGVFIFYPAISGAFNSFFQWDGINDPKFIGFTNYIKIAGDKVFWESIGRTLLFTLLATPLVFYSALGLGLLLVRHIKGRGLFRSIFYWPTMISSIIVGLSWKFLLGEDFGIINYLLSLLHLPTQKFLTDPTWALASVIFVTTWSMAGYYMVMFVAGRNNISETYYEAARIDGASGRQQFRFITMPLLKPTTLLVLVLSLSTILKTYPLVFALTEGGPGRATTFAVQKIYETAFQQNKMGYASAMTMIIFAILALITLLQFRLNRGGEQDAT